MWTLMEGFNHLQPNELDILLEAPVYITVLIGAADGKLDRQEKYWSEKLMETRSYARPKELNEYYRVVAENFLDKVDATLKALPQDTALRTAEVAQKLELLNDILAKLDQVLAYDLYKSYTSLAEETAEASGGFLRIGAISHEEAEWVKLPMLRPIEKPAHFFKKEADKED